MNDTPAVPFIRSGTGRTPAEGGCVMQMVDWIHRNEWTDEPPCVHPVIRHLAIYVNDKLPDDERQKMLDLIPRMVNTNVEGEEMTRKLLGFLARKVHPIYVQWAEKAGYDDKGAVIACLEAAEDGKAARAAEAARAAWAAWAARAAWAAWAASPLTLLIDLLDHYDELTGHEATPVDLTPVCEVMTRA